MSHNRYSHMLQSSCKIFCVLLMSVIFNGSEISYPLRPQRFGFGKCRQFQQHSVFLGDSLTAGYQNGSILDAQQPHGYAPLIAAQANLKIEPPLIAPPGAPAVLQLKSIGPPPVIVPMDGTTTGRDDLHHSGNRR